jgi:CubicO group peptidase (beta-lactamase class C family)
LITCTRRAALVGALTGSSLLATRTGAQALLAGPAREKAEAMARLLAPWAGQDRPGAAVTIMLDGKRVFSRGFGVADLEHGAPITPRTIFHAASVSKQFTAYSILLLAQDGKLSLDDRVEHHLPNVMGPARELSLRHLAHHTGGLRDQYTLLNAGGWRSDDAITEEQMRRMVYRQSGLNFTPGTRFQYTNSGYFLLGQIVRRVSGQPLPIFARERIFQPLGMADTSFHDDNKRIVRGRALSYAPNKTGFEKDDLNDETVGPTGLLTTSEDLCRWAAAFERPQGRSWAMTAMHEQAVLSDETTHYYAMGQERHPYGGLDTWGHGGRDAGYRAYLLRIPGQRFAVAVLSNTAAFDAARIAYAAADIYLADRPGFVVAPKNAPLAPDPASLSRYAGDYELFPGMILRLSDDQTTLSAAWLGDDKPRPLETLSPNSFLYDPAANITLEFDPGVNGRPHGLTYRIGRNGELDAPRLDLADFDKATVRLADYIGLYRCPDLAAEYELLLQGAQLVARHQRLPDIALQPYQPDLFHSFKAFFGRLAFRRNAERRISGFTMSGAVAEGLWFQRVV